MGVRDISKHRFVNGVAEKLCNGRHWVPEDLEHFAPRAKGKPGLQSECRTCSSQRHKADLVRYTAREIIPAVPFGALHPMGLTDENVRLSYYWRHQA